MRGVNPSWSWRRVGAVGAKIQPYPILLKKAIKQADGRGRRKEMQGGTEMGDLGGAPNRRRKSKRRRTLREMLEMNSRFSQSACTAIPTFTALPIPPPCPARA